MTYLRHCDHLASVRSGRTSMIRSRSPNPQNWMANSVATGVHDRFLPLRIPYVSIHVWPLHSSITYVCILSNKRIPLRAHYLV